MDLSSLQTRLAYRFQSEAYLQEALTHKSYLNETNDRSTGDNERFEFLGDAVIDLVVRHKLVSDFPAADEGTLSKMKARIVNADMLARVAREIDLGAALRLGKGEDQGLGRQKDSLLANAIEAVVAAVYLDGGFSKAEAVVMRLLSPFWAEAEAASADYKSELQEYCQSQFKGLPTYRLLRETGLAHQRQFEVEVAVNDIAGVGTGTSKKEAEQRAAYAALRQIEEMKNLMDGS
jgi:ribonuclease III